jgi:hypothetical protein
MTFDPYQAHPLPNPFEAVEGDRVILRESCNGGNIVTILVSEWPDFVRRVNLALERAKKISPIKL